MAFERYLAGLDTTIGSRDSRGGGQISPPTPTPQAVVGTEIAWAVPGYDAI